MRTVAHVVKYHVVSSQGVPWDRDAEIERKNYTRLNIEKGEQYLSATSAETQGLIGAGYLI